MAKSKQKLRRGETLKELTDILISDVNEEKIFNAVHELENNGVATQISVEIKITTPVSQNSVYEKRTYGSFEDRSLIVTLKEHLPEKYVDEMSSLAGSYKNLDELKKEVGILNKAREGWMSTLKVIGGRTIINKTWRGNYTDNSITLATIDYTLLEKLD